MKYYKCPNCKRIRPYQHCVMKICNGCQVQMEVKEEEMSDGKKARS